MRWIRWFAVGLVLIGFGAAGVRAGEEEANASDARAQALAGFLDVLHTRLEAQMQRADTLRQAGRLDEALAIYAELDILFEKEMARITSILDRLAPAAAPAGSPTPRPVIGDEPFVKGPGQGGGGTAAHRALDRALAWLAAHQSPTGQWEAAGFTRWCRGSPATEGPTGHGKALYDVGVTGLALLAFLRNGHTHVGSDEYAAAVGGGLSYLKGVQDAEGCIGARTSQHYIYNHGTAALALVSAYARTRDERLRGTAQKALDFIALSRNPYFAWRYGVKPGDNDTSTTGWMIQTLAVARDVNRKAEAAGLPAPFAIDEGAFDGARAWLDKMTDPEYGRTGYIQRGGGPARPQEMIDRFPSEKSEAMTAVGLAVRVAIGEDPKQSAIMAKGASLLAKLPPRWKDDGSIDMYYWYYGTEAMVHVGGRPWRTWRAALLKALVSHQRKDGDPCGYDGSWDPAGPWGPDGGRVYATAVLALSLGTALYGTPAGAR